MKPSCITSGWDKRALTCQASVPEIRVRVFSCKEHLTLEKVDGDVTMTVF